MSTLTVARGGNRAAQRNVEEKEARKKKGGSWNNWEYLRLAAPADGEVWGESKIIRLVQEESEWLEVKQHSFLKTKPAPADKPSDKGWPKNMGGVCQKSVGMDHCYACDKMKVPQRKNPEKLISPYASTRLWTVAVEREEVIGTQEMFDNGEIEKHEIGGPVGYKDVEVEKEIFEDGKVTGTKMIKKFLVLNFALENFFDSLLGFNDQYGTLLDRDYKVTRKYAGTDTTYSIVPLDVITEANPNGGRALKYDLRRPEIAEKYDYSELFKLLDIIEEQASDEYYNWYFNPEVESSWEARFGKKDDKDDSSEASADEPSNESGAAEAQQQNREEVLEGMRARMNAARGK